MYGTAASGQEQVIASSESRPGPQLRTGRRQHLFQLGRQLSRQQLKGAGSYLPERLVVGLVWDPTTRTANAEAGVTGQSPARRPAAGGDHDDVGVFADVEAVADPYPGGVGRLRRG